MEEKLPEIGKISPEIFNKIIYPHLGVENKNILVPPTHGIDTGIVSLGNGKVMATTTDPIFIVPAYGFKKAAWFAVHILVSDAVTSGLAPTYITMDFNLPLTITTEEFTEMWLTMDKEFKEMGISVISGHTAKYAGVDYPMVGGATVICIGDEDKYVTPYFVEKGDDIVITKGAAVEAAGLFIVTFPEVIKKEFGEQFFKEAENIFWDMSVVKDATIAVEVGVRDNGVTSMHDATECGVIGGLFEIASTAHKGIEIYKDNIPVKDKVKQICEFFNIDPFISISEGTLLITVRPHKTEELINKLNKAGIEAAKIGKIVDEKDGLNIIENGKKSELKHPRIDPFWPAFDNAFKKYGG